MLILGINEGANASVVVSRDGPVVFALQEERVSRQKEYIGFPDQALSFTLSYLGLKPSDFDLVALSNLASPVLTRSSFLNDYDVNAQSIAEALSAGHWRNAAKKAFRHLPDGVRRASRRPRYGSLNQVIDQRLVAHGFDLARVRRFAHHSNHAASAYWGMRADPRSPHLVLTLDGGGDDFCSHVYIAENGHMRLIASTPGGHSVGQIYGRITHLMGMTPHEHEYKLMGMAPYADPVHYQEPLAKLRSYLDIDPDHPLVFKRKIPEDTTFIEPRMAQDFKRVRFDSMAGAIQAFTEELLVKWVKACVKQTGIHKVVAAGGVFMNVKANKLLAELPEIEYFDVFPSCGDETLAFGAAWQAAMTLDPAVNEFVAFDSLYLGPDATYDIDAALKEYQGRLNVETLDDPTATVVRLLTEGHVVARCSGPMEFGARALGNRSLLADAADHHVIARINKAIKQRDFWMPFAPAAMTERAEDYAKIPASLPRPRISPFMMHTFDATERREQFIAGTHPYDGTARLQTVSASFNPGFHAILSGFADKTGKAVLLNTSFNLHGHPIVMGASDAMDVMLRSGIDYLVVGDRLVTKPSIR